MRTAVVFVVLALSSATAAFAQGPPTPTMSSWLRGAYASNRNYIARAAEKMPEEHYGMRPGTQTEVRTFGQLIGHLADYNFGRRLKTPDLRPDFLPIMRRVLG